ncbi:MAG: cytochrome C [Desulfuromonadales bacterium GWD2_61_12]|nr:MAG: cytochrome C [Desulfuromonadales bacterium GWC2_61_20]OGR32034.1 MAG: cytochrome C [Desulfuromonadales bacterium GWD2_61_12]HAD04730.1 cytochrome C [Desulfuromonas sp.]HBT83117.1 cytochrome C [Desulfuromonas sp.]
MRRIIILALIIPFLSIGIALAVSPGKSIEFKESPLGTVTFNGDTHNKAAASCKECHNDGSFPKMKQGTVKITMSDIVAGKYCGVCHNGVKAFEAKANCERCHIKKLM